MLARAEFLHGLRVVGEHFVDDRFERARIRNLLQTLGFDQLIEAKGLKQISDAGALEAIIDEVLANNAKSVEEFRSGKQKAFNALVGQCMKATKGKANPAQVNELLRKKLA